MTEEEQAMKILNNVVKNNGVISFNDSEDNLFKIYDSKSIEVVLNIINRKNKEILELKERIANLESQVFEAEEYLQK